LSHRLILYAFFRHSQHRPFAVLLPFSFYLIPLRMPTVHRLCLRPRRRNNAHFTLFFGNILIYILLQLHYHSTSVPVRPDFPFFVCFCSAFFIRFIQSLRHFGIVRPHLDVSSLAISSPIRLAI
jgi:hypothetical protein